MTTIDPIDQVRMLLSSCGPLAENAVITNTEEPRVLFDSLHLPLTEDAAKVRHWDLTVPEALLVLTGLFDGANYVMQLQQMAEEIESRHRN